MNTKDLNKYSDAEKILMAEDLWDSVAKENLAIPEETAYEIDVRLKKLEEGNTPLYSWQEVKDRIKQIR
ncbi:addiction module protein [Flavobacterium sp. RHBU_3]|uniref:addiction module protein n=1 Tax=Flavobacterium sp. RHBU_3 TaxID=3391184 RepID=UPI003984B0E0